ncbi:hypothetical protein M0812_01479 [Anaeramoeba flamelloides]|uniref:Reverse transcriptase domain-containing protein n=1 Tax=Anaeramoeba flamelloides TaxID=1746091 RepID=A0AAV8A7P9_9EUKA|nr:hypothetical protein M0812_01479 [Anaeramoeba flamelloides]
MEKTLIVFFCFVSLFATCFGETINLHPGDSLKDAVNNANDGDIIQLFPGVHRVDQIDLPTDFNKPGTLTIMGTESTNPAKSILVYVDASNVPIQTTTESMFILGDQENLILKNLEIRACVNLFEFTKSNQANLEFSGVIFSISKLDSFNFLTIPSSMIGNEKDYLLFLKNVQRIFLHWINNPNEEIINFIKERNILFIHKAGDEGVPLNYRPISINNTLARFFLKLIYKGIEDSWNLVSDSQFGFKKKLDTRIAVLNLLFELNKIKTIYKNKEFFIVTIDIKKCFDTISHILVHHALNKYIKNQKIKIWLQKYYKKEGIGVYQGDPLSPLMFGFISHFLIEKITDLVHHVQMFADDLILIMEGPISEIDKKLILIFKIIQEFGMNPNKDKTLKSNQL